MRHIEEGGSYADDIENPDDEYCPECQHGCTFTGTTDEILDTTKNVTVSTSGETWWNQDGLLKPEYKGVAFSAVNYWNLEQDIARGRGEYLDSLAALTGIEESARPAFEANAQGRFETLGKRKGGNATAAITGIGKIENLFSYALHRRGSWTQVRNTM